MLGLVGVAELAKLAKIGPGLFAGTGEVGGPGSYGHKAFHANLLERCEAGEKRGKLFGGEAVLGFSGESLTSMRMESVLPRAAAASLRRVAMRTESTVSMAWKSLAAGLVLLDWSGR